MLCFARSCCKWSAGEERTAIEGMQRRLGLHKELSDSYELQVGCCIGTWPENVQTEIVAAGSVWYVVIVSHLPFSCLCLMLFD